MIVVAAAILCAFWTFLLAYTHVDIYIGVHPTVAQQEAAGAFQKRFAIAYLTLVAATIVGAVAAGFWTARRKT